MKSTDLYEIRLSCLIEAGKLKQNPKIALATEEKSIIEIAKEFEAYIFGEEPPNKKQ